MHNINAVALNLHDHNVYDGKFHRQMERYTRFKHNLKRKDGKLDTNNYDLNNEFVNEYFKKTNDILAFSYTIGGIRKIRDILDKELNIRTGDFISYGDNFFEITSVVYDKSIFGQIEHVTGLK